MQKQQMPFQPIQRHPLTGAPIAPLGFRKDGRPIMPIMGGAPDGDEGQGGDSGDQGGGLLDDAANNGGGDGGNGDQGGDGQGGGQGEGGNVDTQAIVDQVVKALEGQFDSIADRRVNAILKEVRKGSGQGGGNQGGDEGQGGNGGGQQQQVESGPAAGDVREARLAYREYVSDGFRFLGDVEREHAMTLAQGMLPGLLAGGMDPDEAGRKAAQQVKTSVQALRKHYENQTVAALKRKGLLPEDGRPGGQPPRGPATPGGAAGYQAGAAKAAEIVGHRMPQTQTSSN